MISVIIPTLNEASNIGRCIDALRSESKDIEIIVADGGSSDNTREIATGCGVVKIVDSEAGRGLQMNKGAAASSGDILLFLHADTSIEQGWSDAVPSVIEKDCVAGGAFTFAVDGDSWSYRLVEAWVRMRCALLELPYGDQAIFVKRNIFEAVGGYRDIPLMEDVDLVGRVKKVGKISILRHRVLTSPRRWEEKGIIKTAAINQVIMLLYRLGVNPDRLFRYYYR